MCKFFLKITESNKINTRIDKILSEIQEIFDKGISRARIQKLISEGFLEKNGEKLFIPSYKVKLEDEFTLTIKEAENSTLVAKEIPLDIVFEDENLMVINKQAGLTTHPGAGNTNNTLVNALINYCGTNLSGVGGVLRPGIVHRLDKDTSGLMVVAKNDIAHQSLSEQIQTRTLSRTYNAFIWGLPFPERGIIEGYIQRNKNNRLKMELTENSGKYSKTNYSVLENYSSLVSLVECKLDTGRTHQIRVHFSNNGHPLIGDILYGGYGRKLPNYIDEETKLYVDKFPRQALHSKRISFFHPVTKKKLEFDVPLSNDMDKLLKLLRKI